MNSVLSLMIGLVLASQLISACFITNCPPGGKRSVSNRIQSDLKKQCQRCGPTGIEGQCFGPNICCGPSIGCQIDNAISKICRMENLSTRPCQIEGKKCGRSLTGVCASGSICCESDRCYEDKTCSQATKDSKYENIVSVFRNGLQPNYLGYKHNLLPEVTLDEENAKEIRNKILLDLLEKSEKFEICFHLKLLK